MIVSELLQTLNSSLKQIGTFPCGNSAVCIYSNIDNLKEELYEYFFWEHEKVFEACQTFFFYTYFCDNQFYNRLLDFVQSRCRHDRAVSSHISLSYNVYQISQDEIYIPVFTPTHTILKSGKTYILISASMESLLRTSPRVIRQFILRTLEEEGGVMLHASAIIYNDSAYIFVGPSGAGKTTAITYLIEETGAYYLTNDRLIVKRTNQHFGVFSIPLSVRLTPETIQRSNLLSKYTANNKLKREGSDIDKKIELTPREYVSALDTYGYMHSVLNRVFLLTRHPNSKLSVYTTSFDIVQDELRKQLRTPKDKAFPDDWFGLRHSDPDDLLKYANLTLESISLMPTFQVVWGSCNKESFASAISSF